MSDFCADLDLLFTELPFIDRFKAARDNGFTLAEFTVPENVDLGKLGDACACDGLKIAGISAPKNDVIPALNKKTHALFEERFARLSDIADFIAAPFIYIPPVAGTIDTAVFGAAMKRAAKIARQNKQKILFGFENPIENDNVFPASTKEVLDLLNLLDDDRVFGILYDVYHAQTGEGGLSNTLETLMPLIGHVRIAGAPMRGEPDDGEINYPYLLALLNAHGYTHAVSASYVPRIDTISGLRWMKTF